MTYADSTMLARVVVSQAQATSALGWHAETGLHVLRLAAGSTGTRAYR